MDKIRLLLRSVYLKGHQDALTKTSDLSWEDLIIQEIQQELIKMLPSIKGDDYLELANKVKAPMGEVIQYQYGWNDCREDIKAKLEKE